MAPETIADLLSRQPFFAGLDAEALGFIADCGENVHFEAGRYLFREGNDADRFFVVRDGHVALESYAPGRGPLVIDTVAAGELLGISWLVPPYRLMFDARAVVDVRATAFDGACIRAKCEHDAELGFELMQRVAVVMQKRLQSARVRLLDLYGGGRAG